MTDYTPSALAMLTEFFTTETIEQTARRTGFVKRTSKITGKIFLALMTFGLWSDGKTTLAQLATKVTQLGTHQEVSAEAIHQRMNQHAVSFLQDMIRQALAKLQTLEHVCDDNLFAFFTKVYIADSTGFGLPACLEQLFPGSGGSASKAGASGGTDFLFGDKDAGPAECTSTSCSFVTPPGSPGDADVKACVGGACSATAAKFHYTGPTVTGFSPSHGPVTGGTSVEIDGTSLPQDDRVQVFFGDVQALQWGGCPLYPCALSPP